MTGRLSKRRQRQQQAKKVKKKVSPVKKNKRYIMSCVVFAIKVTIDAHVQMIIHHAVELESMKGTDLLDSFI